MKRLTEHDEFGNADIIQASGNEWQGELDYETLVAVTEGLNRLADYEDTGLMPEEIKSLISDAGINIAMRNRELKVENDRLKKALEQAQADTAILRDALEQINNLIETEDEDDYMYFSSDKAGEIYESMRNKITSTTAGRDYLDRMRKLESALISLKNGPFIWDKSWTQMIDDALNGDAPFEDLEASTDG